MKTAEKSPAPAERTAAKPTPARETARTTDAQALQQFFHAGTLRAKSLIGAADDPLERDADRMADLALAGRPSSCTCAAGAPTCAGCRAKADALIRRKPSRRAASRDAGNLDLGSSRALSPSERSPFEASWRADLSSIRVHDNPSAAASAARIGARAFNLGDHVAFGAGEYARGTRDGQRLLGHELAHALQGGDVVRRAPPDTPSPDSYDLSDPKGKCEQPPAVVDPSVTKGPAKVDHAADWDPCKVDVKSLTNYQLLAELNHVGPTVKAGRDAAGFFDHRNLQRRLKAEVGRRVSLGDAWMAELPAGVPPSVLQIVDKGDGTADVVEIPGTTVAGDPSATKGSPYLSRAQFDDMLKRERVATMAIEEYQRDLLEEQLAGGASMLVAGMGLYNSPLDAQLVDPFNRNILGNSGGEIMKWRGRFGEGGFQAKATSGFGGFFNEDLNARNWTNIGNNRVYTPAQEAYPGFDFERKPWPAKILGAARVSVKTSLQATPAGRYSYYRQGLADMLDVSGKAGMRNYIANQPQYTGQPTTGAQYGTNRSTVLADAYMAVNSEDVANFRAILSNPSQPETLGGTTAVWDDTGRTPGQPPRQGYRPIFAGEMREHPVRIGTNVYDSPNALDAALSSGAITADEHANAQRQVGRRIANRLVGAGITGPEVSNLRTARLNFGALTDVQMAPIVTDEWIRTQRLGGGVTGNAKAVAGASAQGAAAGSVIAVMTTLGVMIIDEKEHPDWASELATTGGMGALGGGFGAGAEQLTVSLATQRSLSIAASGGTSRLMPFLSGTGGKFIGGGAGSLATELISMGFLEDREHSGLEVGVRSTRAFVLGGASTVVGIKAGAAIGTAVAPGVGTAAGAVIGFLVGVGIGAFTYYASDKLVPGGREDFDAIEEGCRTLPTVDRWRAASSYNAYGGHCFEASTSVTLADGTRRRIADVAIGDIVLSYDEAANRLVHAAVTGVHEGAPDLMLALTLDDGTRIDVTPAHKLYAGDGWRAAGDLDVGDALWCAAPDGAALMRRRVAAVARTLPRGTVYDLSVENIHTYFAGDVLAHNKQ